MLNFSDTANSSKTIGGAAPPDMMHILRRNALQLILRPKPLNQASAAAHLAPRASYLRALDGPGIPIDPMAYPLAWSIQNSIAVICEQSVYVQHLASRRIIRLGTIEDGRLNTIEWGGRAYPATLAVGNNRGCLKLFDVFGLRAQNQSDDTLGASWGMSWHEHVLAVGRSSGVISLFDVRESMATTARKILGHRGAVYGVKWNQDGRYLATGDHNGSVFIWDARGCKALQEGGTKGHRMKHGGAVKV